jgi:hypothetical protein
MLSEQVVSAKTGVDSSSLVKLLLVADGDVHLVAERLRGLTGLPVTPLDIMSDFADAPVAETMGSIKNMLLLTFVQLLGETKATLMAGLPEMSVHESIQVFKLIAEGIGALMAQAPSAGGVNVQVNNLSMQESPREKLREKLGLVE